MLHPERPLFAFAAALLILAPTPWHWKTRNIATLSMIAWIFMDNVLLGINSSIWAGHSRILAVGWCDFGLYPKSHDSLLTLTMAQPQRLLLVLISGFQRLFFAWLCILSV
jgi:hypothetical protein